MRKNDVAVQVAAVARALGVIVVYVGTQLGFMYMVAQAAGLNEGVYGAFRTAGYLG